MDFRDTLADSYFHELESRESIFNRLQLNLGIQATVIAALAYMAKVVDYEASCRIVTLFYVGIASGVSLIAMSAYLTVKSLTGFKYMTLPKAWDVVSYKKSLDIYASTVREYNDKYGSNYPIKDPFSEVNDYLMDIMARCIDRNSEINENRRKMIRRAIWYMILSAAPITFAGALFTFYDLDASSPRKNLLIEDNKVAEKLGNLNQSIASLLAKSTIKETYVMSPEKESKVPPPPVPPPPLAPQKPEPQYSTEDFKGPSPSKDKILTEDR